MKRSGLLLIILSIILILSSCGLLPEEETFRTVPMIDTYEKEEFKQTLVVRGDMRLTENIDCSYIPMQTEMLSFPVSGEYFDEVFVRVGDSVKKGQLLAQLDLSGAQETMDDCSAQIDTLKVQIAALEENRALELKRQKILLSDSSEEELNEALERTNRQYDAQKQKFSDELTVAQIRMNEAKALLEERQMYAGIDGTVTYIRDFDTDDQSVADQWFMTVADTTTSLFRAETKLWDQFNPGDEYVITVNKTEYETVVVSEAEIGIEETEKQEGEKGYVYLKLKDPAFNLEEQARGTLVLLLDSRTDVLMVSKSAISTANGQSVVYYQDENGLKTYKQVETGLTVNGMVEIISGLTEGESVIVE